MRRLLVFLLAILLIAGCAGDGPTPTKTKTTSTKAKASPASDAGVTETASTSSSTTSTASASSAALSDVPDDWPTFQHDPARTGSAGAGPGTTWSYAVHSTIGSNHVGAVALVNGLAVAPTFDENLTALDATTGKAVWRRPLADYASQSLAAAGDLLYFVEPGAVSRLLVLDAATGKEHCTASVGSHAQGTPVVAGGRVFLQSGGLRVFDAATCTQIWKTAFDFYTGTPAVVNHTVFAVGNDFAAGLDIATGDRLWQQDLYKPTAFVPVLPVKGLVIVASFEDALYALDQRTGTVAWNVSLPGKAGGTASDGMRIYAATDDGSVVAVDAAKGKVLWTRKLEVSASSVAVGGATVFVSAGDLHAFSAATGAPKWVADGFYVSSPTLAAGIVYVNGMTDVRALSASTGL